jgi:hypothetical protein
MPPDRGGVKRKSLCGSPIRAVLDGPAFHDENDFFRDVRRSVCFRSIDGRQPIGDEVVTMM